MQDVRIETLADLDALKARGLERIYPERMKIAFGYATCGVANGAAAALESLTAAAGEAGLDALVDTTGCIGYCQVEPLVDVWIPGRPRLVYQRITPKKAAQLVKDLQAGDVKKGWVLYQSRRDPYILTDEIRAYDVDGGNGAYAGIPAAEEVPFFAKQFKIALRNCGHINPVNLDEYVARGGFYALHKVLTTMSPEDVVNEVKDSGLRGRGGGGFPTGRKWATARRAAGDVKYILCNADEGDPGAYMDRAILEGDPYAVLEGMLIGAYAVGSSDTGYIYVRHEYPRALETLEAALAAMRDHGLLGERIMGSDLNFDVKINRGGGAFVCGESTALMASLEGKRGDPRSKYVHTVEVGLWGKPTVLNNVETWANVPAVVMRGGEWFKAVGTPTNAGTKVFSLVGNIKRTGLVEVPMGITLREIIFDIGGGIPKDKEFKGVQTGGPSGGCLPAEQLDLPVDFDALSKVGSMMGSGGMIVMDEDTCMVDVARYFLDFLAEESCGKCTPCREGVRIMHDILTRITQGEGRDGDIELLEEIGLGVQRSSLCGLGQSAPNPLLSTIRYYRDEYEAHIRDKKCPGGVCKALITYAIDPDKCTGCALCAERCPENCITGEKKQAHVIDAAACIKCNACYEACNFDAVLRQ
jgi:NADH:ubiquinone oxidoreductase subunit F (NADH-binding)/(2Fe-2S) ferredoxin